VATKALTAQVGRLLTGDQVAEVLQVPRSTLYAWAYKGYGPPFVRIGKHVRYPEEQLEAWVRDQAGGLIER
jgi:excisionase family DNA binding protein